MQSKKTIQPGQRQNLERLIDAALAEVRSTIDVSTLSECRTLFKKRVPFSLRTWVAAAMALQAVQDGNASQGRQRQRDQKRRDEAENRQSSRSERHERSERNERAERADRSERADRPARQPADAPAQVPGENHPSFQQRENRYQGEGPTLFVSAGRRQRFYARVALKLIADHTGFEETSIGDIRTMDNYSFITVDPAVEQRIIDGLHGVMFRGRPLTVNPARKRDDQDADGEIQED